MSKIMENISNYYDRQLGTPTALQREKKALLSIGIEEKYIKLTDFNVDYWDNYYYIDYLGFGIKCNYFCNGKKNKKIQFNVQTKTDYWKSLNIPALKRYFDTSINKTSYYSFYETYSIRVMQIFIALLRENEAYIRLLTLTE